MAVYSEPNQGKGFAPKSAITLFSSPRSDVPNTKEKSTPTAAKDRM